MDLRIVIVCLLFLSACSTVNRNSQQDGGPTRPVDVSRIDDAVPVPVVRTRAGNAKAYTVLGKTYRTMEDSRGYQKRGMASWYGTKFHGRRTANGEVYDMFAMTAAHKTLPIPSYVRVTNVNNGVSVVVKINDRGPFHGDRIIDLSYAAARKLGIAAVGTGLVDVVDITPVTDPVTNIATFNPTSNSNITSTSTSTPTPNLKPNSSVNLNSNVNAKPDFTLESATSTAGGQPLQYSVQQAAQKIMGLYLQLGAFQTLGSAQSLRSRLMGILSAPVNVVEGSDKLHRVTLGPAKGEQQVARWQQVLQQNDIAIGYIVRY